MSYEGALLGDLTIELPEPRYGSIFPDGSYFGWFDETAVRGFKSFLL